MRVGIRIGLRILALASCLAASGFLTKSTHAQSALPTLAIQADPQTKIYGQPDPAFSYTIRGFTNGDTAAVLSGQPVITAPQRVQNLWQFTESLPAWLVALWQFNADGGTQQSNGIQLSHVATAGNFYSQVSAPLAAFPAPIVYPGMQYLLSFYAVSNMNGNQVYWHRSLENGSVPGWGPTAIGQSVRRIVFRCAGTTSGALDCGSIANVPLGSGPDQTSISWLFLGKNNALDGNPSAPGFQQSVPADILLGGFQMEPTVTEKRGVLAMGDSLTQYDCSTDDSLACTSWTAFAASQLDVPFYNRGIASQTCAQIQARWASDASPILAANAKYAIIFCGTNDISSGLTAAQTEQSIAAMTALATADGAIPVVATVGPFTTTVPNAESTRQTINSWIRSTYPLVLDFDKVNADVANPASQNPVYVGDGVHLNLAGRIAEGNYAAQSVAGNANGYPGIWNFHAPIPYQPVLGLNPSNGTDFHPGAQRETGSYIILPAAGTLASNQYSFSFSSALLTVAPAPLTVAANNKSMTYGEPIPTLDGSITGVLQSDNISASYSTSATRTSPPGTYAIAPALVDPGNRLSNYTVTQNSGTLTITPATCAAPTFSVTPGTYVSPLLVSVFDSTAGAVIHYTVDGTAPTGDSAVYTGPIPVANSETVQAVAIALPGYVASPVEGASYSIVPVVSSFSPAYTSAGATGLTLTVTGTGFNPGSVVHFAGTALPTQFVSPTQLSAQVPGSLLAASGIASVSVQDAANTSSKLQFEIDSSSASAYAPLFNPATGTVSPGATATYQVTLPSAVVNASISCLNLPANAICSYKGATGVVTIATSSATPAGVYPVVVVFTETVPIAASAWLFFPFLLIPAARVWNRQRAMNLRLCALLLLLLAGGTALSGCGGKSGVPAPTRQVTSSGVITINVQ